MTKTMKRVLLSAAVLPLVAGGLAGCSASGITQAAQMVDKARKVQKTAERVEQVTGQDMGLLSDPLGTKARAEAAQAAVVADSQAALVNAAPISSAPMPVTEMRKTSGKTKTLTMRPKLAVAGYNVAAFTEGKVSGTAGTGILNRTNYGARSTMELTATGIDAAMLTRVADAASADLVAQLSAAGFDVVSPADVSRAEHFSTLKAGGAPSTKKMTTEGGKKSAIVAGPSGFGVRTVGVGIPEQGFGAMASNPYSNAPAKLSNELDAVLVMPALLLDFADMKGSRNLSRFSPATTEADLSFSISPMTTITTTVSKNGRFTDSTAMFGVKKAVYSDAAFASWGAETENKNTLEQGLGAALGMKTMAKKVTTKGVNIDPERYEALAMSAAKGWNRAFVEQVSAARATSS
jgi:hypothetical protein